MVGFFGTIVFLEITVNVFFRFAWREGIFHHMGAVFLFVAGISCMAVLFGPLQLTASERSQHYARDVSGTQDLLWALIPPVIVALLYGFVMTALKGIFYRRQQNFI